MSRPFVLGIDCTISVQKAEDRATVPPQTPPTVGPFPTFVEIGTAMDVTLNLTAATADVTTRAAGGWRQNVATLKEGTVDFTVLWEPDDEVFTELMNSYLDQCPLRYLVLDGPKDGFVSSGDTHGRCSEVGDVTGLLSDFMITSFSRNEALEEGVTADVTLEVSLGLQLPTWIVMPEPV